VGKRRGAVPAIYDARESTEGGVMGCGPTLLLQIFWRSLCGADSLGREAERSSGHAFRQVRICDQSQNRRTDSPRSLFGRLKSRGQRRGNSKSLPAMQAKLEPDIPDPVTVISIRKNTDARRNTEPRTQVWLSGNPRTNQLHRGKKHDQIQVSSRSRNPVDDDRDSGAGE
jgi:hypothetical protein